MKKPVDSNRYNLMRTLGTFVSFFFVCLIIKYCRLQKFVRYLFQYLKTYPENSYYITALKLICLN